MSEQSYIDWIKELDRMELIMNLWLTDSIIKEAIDIAIECNPIFKEHWNNFCKLLIKYRLEKNIGESSYK